jgi:5-oxoprolinase (ATP-hydrolysing) subunit A
VGIFIGVIKGAETKDTVIDLNCDMGELEDFAYEAALMEYVTSASIACGGHTGDEASMERTARLAMERGARIGAHPSYPDRANFGRLEIVMTAAEVEAAVRSQIERLECVVASLGGRIVHVKPHGALYNVAARDPEVAAAIGRVVSAWNPQAAVFGLAKSPALEIWRRMGLRVAAEAFADRRYEPDGSLRNRKFPDALVTDPDEAARQAARFAREGRAETICVHSDTPNALEILKACREALRKEL